LFLHASDLAALLAPANEGSNSAARTVMIATTSNNSSKVNATLALLSPHRAGQFDPLPLRPRQPIDKQCHACKAEQVSQKLKSLIWSKSNGVRYYCKPQRAKPHTDAGVRFARCMEKIAYLSRVNDSVNAVNA
jgi:hypothetical protein